MVTARHRPSALTPERQVVLSLARFRGVVVNADTCLLESLADKVHDYAASLASSLRRLSEARAAGGHLYVKSIAAPETVARYVGALPAHLLDRVCPLDEWLFDSTSATRLNPLGDGPGNAAPLQELIAIEAAADGVQRALEEGFGLVVALALGNASKFSSLLTNGCLPPRCIVVEDLLSLRFRRADLYLVCGQAARKDAA